MKILITSIAFIIVIAGCKKNESSAVMIKIKNNTDLLMDSVHLIYDATNYNYKKILSAQESSYHSFASIQDDPAAYFFINGKTIIAGPLIPPNSFPPSFLATGNYTLEIFADSSLVTGYNAKYVKN